MKAAAMVSPTATLNPWLLPHFRYRGFADFAPEQHQRALVKVLNLPLVVVHLGASREVSRFHPLLHEEALLGALEAEGEGDALLAVAVETCTVFFVALVLETARLEPKNFRQHHANELG